MEESKELQCKREREGCKKVGCKKVGCKMVGCKMVGCIQRDCIQRDCKQEGYRMEICILNCKSVDCRMALVCCTLKLCSCREGVEKKESKPVISVAGCLVTIVTREIIDLK
jgi:hypothetical protein